MTTGAGAAQMAATDQGLSPYALAKQALEGVGTDLAQVIATLGRLDNGTGTAEDDADVRLRLTRISGSLEAVGMLMP